MKDLLEEVKEFNLKQIVENMGNIPKDGRARFGDEIEKLTPKQKKQLMEKISNFNEFGKVLRCETAIMEMARDLTEIGKMAESYALTESGDYFQAEVVKRDFKDTNGMIKEFSKTAKKCYSDLQMLNAIFENLGQKFGRYFEIKSLDEVSSPNMEEIVGDETSCSVPFGDQDQQGKLNGERNLGVN